MAKRLLVVERDQDILDVIHEILSDAGYHVSSFRSPNGVLQRILEERPDAVLLDVVNPSREGSELCEAIKAYDAVKHIPVIVLSTHVKAKDLTQTCADEVVAKPFDIDELIQVIDSLVPLGESSSHN